MKLASLLLLPAAAVAFAPVSPIVVSPTRASTVTLHDALDDVDDAVKKIEDTTEKYAGKADDLVLNRAMRFANHAPILVTLKALADKAGMSATLTGSVTANPGAFAGLSTALSVPTWCYNVWALAALSQLASVAKSALASDSDELSQADITATAVSNFAAVRMIGSANPLRDTIITALVSSYALRNNNAAGDVTVHNASTQLVASFTTTLAVLGTVSAAVARIPFLSDIPELSTLLGVASMYIINKRADNGTVKNAVNGGILAGMLYNRVIGGLSFALTGASLMSTITLFCLASVTTGAVNQVRKAVFN